MSKWVSIVGSSKNADLFDRYKGAAPDGKTDLLWPMPSAGRSGIPVWMILQATGNVGDGTFEPIDSGIPFEAEALLDAKVTLADPHGPRVTDVDGDGIQDVLLSVGNVFHVFKNVLHEEDLLVSVTDGMNGHDPGDPDFMPNVQISYEHLIDLCARKGGIRDTLRS